MTNSHTIVVIIRRERVTQKGVSPTRAKGPHWNILSTFSTKYLTLQTWKESDEPGAERGERKQINILSAGAQFNL